MANFRQHLFYGVSAAVLGSVVGYFRFGLNEMQSIAAMILGTMGSMAPDLDHDESIPGSICFEILGVLTPILLFPYIPKYYHGPLQIEHQIVFFFAGYMLVRHLGFWIFSKLTVHRGIFHSLPAMVIWGETIFLAFAHLALRQRITMASVGMAGYLSHLLADEFYSVDWKDNEIKQSFGTAIDLGHITEFSTWMAYILILALGYLIWQTTPF